MTSIERQILKNQIEIMQRIEDLEPKDKMTFGRKSGVNICETSKIIRDSIKHAGITLLFLFLLCLGFLIMIGIKYGGLK